MKIKDFLISLLIILYLPILIVIQVFVLLICLPLGLLIMITLFIIYMSYDYCKDVIYYKLYEKRENKNG